MKGLRAEAVLFDKDGTLFDFNATWVAWAEAMLARWSGGDQALGGRLAAALGFPFGGLPIAQSQAGLDVLPLRFV